MDRERKLEAILGRTFLLSLPIYLLDDHVRNLGSLQIRGSRPPRTRQRDHPHGIARQHSSRSVVVRLHETIHRSREAIYRGRSIGNATIADVQRSDREATRRI